ncbi:hypothetical protein C8Q73DRAFT_344831 [Cubamyces lactineus]|nr:hypothetical protein C8Q73DRAFT_344831 [Cubamyces lactineus]
MYVMIRCPPASYLPSTSHPAHPLLIRCVVAMSASNQAPPPSTSSRDGSPSAPFITASGPSADAPSSVPCVQGSVPTTTGMAYFANFLRFPIIPPMLMLPQNSIHAHASDSLLAIAPVYLNAAAPVSSATSTSATVASPDSDGSTVEVSDVIGGADVGATDDVAGLINLDTISIPPSPSFASTLRSDRHFAHQLLQHIENSRTSYFAQYGIKVENINVIEPLMDELLLCIMNQHTVHRRSVRDKLSSLASEARQLNAHVALEHALVDMWDQVDQLKQRLCEVVRCFEETQDSLSAGDRADIPSRLSHIGLVADRCATQAHSAHSELGTLLDCLQILTYSPVQFATFLESLPTYRAKGCVDTARRTLSGVVSDCHRLHLRIHHGRMTLKLVKAIWAQAGVQNEVFVAIKAELQAAERVLDVVHVADGTLPISDLMKAVSAYTSTMIKIDGVQTRLLKAREALNETSHHLLVNAAMQEQRTRN